MDVFKTVINRLPCCFLSQTGKHGSFHAEKYTDVNCYQELFRFLLFACWVILRAFMLSADFFFFLN